MTWTDEIVDEVRLCADMRQQQAASKRRIVAVTKKEVKAEKPETPPAA